MFQEEENKKVQFKEWQRPDDSYSSSDGSKFSQLIRKYSNGLVQNEKQANVILVGFVILVIVISLFLIMRGNSTTKVEKNFDSLTGEEILPGQIPGQI